MDNDRIRDALNTGMNYVSAKGELVRASEYINRSEIAQISRGEAVMTYLKLRLNRAIIRRIAKQYGDYNPLELESIREGTGKVLMDCDLALRRLEGIIGMENVKAMEDAGSVSEIN